MPLKTMCTIVALLELVAVHGLAQAQIAHPRNPNQDTVRAPDGTTITLVLEPGTHILDSASGTTRSGHHLRLSFPKSSTPNQMSFLLSGDTLGAPLTFSSTVDRFDAELRVSAGQRAADYKVHLKYGADSRLVDLAATDGQQKTIKEEFDAERFTTGLGAASLSSFLGTLIL
jgi:hypothetical protein